MNVIEVNNVIREFRIAERDTNFFRFLFCRKYKTKRAVNDISFKIKEGELVGFIGPNGAGKSTTIKMMSGILVPSAGVVKVLGMIPHEERKKVARQIGVVFGQRSQLWWDLPVTDTFALLKKIYKIGDETYEKNLALYGELLGIHDFINQPVRQLSLGQRMRADLCAALLHDPQILFLDEPTIGLDVVVKKQIREMIKKINQTRNVTVILTTHDMKDVEEICDRIILINEGKIVMDGPVAEIKKDFRGVSEIKVLTEKKVEKLEIPMAKEIMLDGCNICVKYDAHDISSAEILTEIVKENKVVNIEIMEPQIDDIVRNLYGMTENN